MEGEALRLLFIGAIVGSIHDFIADGASLLPYIYMSMHYTTIPPSLYIHEHALYYYSSYFDLFAGDASLLPYVYNRMHLNTCI